MAFYKCKACGEKIPDKTVAYYDEVTDRYYCSEEHCKQYMIQLKKPSSLCHTCGVPARESTCIQKYNHVFCDENCVLTYEKKPENAQEVMLGYIYYNIRNSNTKDYVIIQQQAEHFVKKYKLKYPAMTLTCKYWHEVLGKEWNEEYHLGQIFPYYYVEAEVYYKQRKKAWDGMKNPDVEPEPRIVTANTNKMRYKIHIDDISEL